MGTVYRMDFPDGSFYIGATINLKNRIAQHHCRSTNKQLKEKIKEFVMPKCEFDKIFTTLHEGDDYKYIEFDIIQYNNKNKLCLNVAGKWGLPTKNRQVMLYIPKDLEKYLPEMIAEAKKDNEKDGLGKYLVNLHIEKKRGEKP